MVVSIFASEHFLCVFYPCYLHLFHLHYLFLVFLHLNVLLFCFSFCFPFVSILSLDCLFVLIFCLLFINFLLFSFFFFLILAFCARTTHFSLLHSTHYIPNQKQFSPPVLVLSVPPLLKLHDHFCVPHTVSCCFVAASSLCASTTCDYKTDPQHSTDR